jgi:predicted XRE-type DNA-binding protein
MEQYLKPLYWLGSARKDLQAMPETVQDTFGYALYLAQTGAKHHQVKPLKGFGSAAVLEVAESKENGTYRAVYTLKLRVETARCRLRAALFPEEVDLRHLDTKARHGPDPRAPQGSRSACERRNGMTEIERGSGNVYADLDLPGDEEMLVKARLAAKIQEIIDARDWTQREAAQVLGMTQPKLSNLLRGQFRGISETKMLQCLARLGRDVRIVVGPDRHVEAPGHIEVVFAA